MQLYRSVFAGLVSLTLALSLQNAELIDVSQSRLRIPLVSPESFVDSPIARHSALNEVNGEAPSRFIVILKRDLTFVQVSDFKSHFLLLHTDFALDLRIKPNAPRFFSIHTLNGVVSFLSPSLLDTVRSDPRVLLVELDAITQIEDPPHTLQIQQHSSWGLNRISHRKNPGEDPLEYLYDEKGGAGVNVYVMDSGIDVSHPEFEGRARWGMAVAPPKDKVDHSGHGTHIAGIIGSLTYGVSKKVNMIAMGVSDPDKLVADSDAIFALEWVEKDHDANVAAGGNGFKGLVINFSITKEKNPTLDMAINAAVDAGIHVAVSAGNERMKACDFSPAGASGPITVGAIGDDDRFARYSNWGTCVDVFAPGMFIDSTSPGSGTKESSGTLMSSAYVSGLLAYFLSVAPPSMAATITPANLKRRLLKFATPNVIQGLGDTRSPNLLVFNGAGGDLADFWKDDSA